MRDGNLLVILLARNYILLKLKPLLYRTDIESLTNLFSEPTPAILQQTEQILPLHLKQAPCRHSSCVSLHQSAFSLSILISDSALCVDHIGLEKEDRQK
jgi:hypothetical protein